jgi:acyl-CoA thioesterase FadM
MFAGERCVATGVSVMVTIDDETRRPKPLSAELRRWLEARLPR